MLRGWARGDGEGLGGPWRQRAVLLLQAGAPAGVDGPVRHGVTVGAGRAEANPRAGGGLAAGVRDGWHLRMRS